MLKTRQNKAKESHSHWEGIDPESLRKLKQAKGCKKSIVSGSKRSVS